MKSRTPKKPPWTSKPRTSPRARPVGKATRHGLEQTASMRALHRAVYGRDPDPLGTLVRQAGWAGLDGDLVWARRLLEEAREARVDADVVWAAYEAGRRRPDEVER